MEALRTVPTQLPTVVDAVVVAAMRLELQPYLDAAEWTGEAHTFGRAELVPATIAGKTMLLVESGIGLVNAAAAATHALGAVTTPVLISTGTAGGLTNVSVGDVAVGDRYVYGLADATAFGYAAGQIPGMPEAYVGAPGLLEVARRRATNLARGGIVPAELGGSRVPQVVVGTLVSSDSFIAGPLLDVVLQRMPDAIATDMESAALAQVAYSLGVEFLSVRGISDMCSHGADEQFYEHADDVGGRAADLVIDLLTTPRTPQEAPQWS